MGTLTGEQYEDLANALLGAFPSPAKLRQMLDTKPDENLGAIALGEDYADIVFKVVSAAEAEGWTARLVANAQRSRRASASRITSEGAEPRAISRYRLATST